MPDISIDLRPDPEQDRQARRAALALITATLFDADESAPSHELSGAALSELIENVVGAVGEVRPESLAALQQMLSVVSRQYNGFAAVSIAVAAEAFAAGQREPDAEEADYESILRGVSSLLETLPEQ